MSLVTEGRRSIRKTCLLLLLFLVPAVLLDLHWAARGSQRKLLEGVPVVDGPYTRIHVAGDSPRNGIFDPSLEYDGDGVGWLAYSAVEGPGKPVGEYVSTRLAKSTDHGATWTFVKEVNRSFEATLDFVDGSKLRGVWRYEVPALVYDPGDPGKEWKLFTHRYFWTQEKDRMFAYGWVSYRSAHDPAGEWSGEIPLFGAGKFPPAPYHQTRIDLNALSPALRDTVAYSEFGVLAADGALYMSLGAARRSGPDTIVLIVSRDHGATWKFLGTLLTRRDAREFGFDFFDGSSLAEERGRFFLLVVPSENGPRHEGTMVMEFKDLARAELRRDAAGRLEIQKYIHTDPSVVTHVGGGQSDYDPQNTAGGLILSQFSVRNYPGVFQIYSTHAALVDSRRP